MVGTIIVSIHVRDTRVIVRVAAVELQRRMVQNALVVQVIVYRAAVVK